MKLSTWKTVNKPDRMMYVFDLHFKIYEVYKVNDIFNKPYYVLSKHSVIHEPRYEEMINFSSKVVDSPFKTAYNIIIKDKGKIEKAFIDMQIKLFKQNKEK